MGGPVELRETLVSVENVSQTLGGNKILRDVTFEIKNIHRPGFTQGQVVGLLGPSGIGKTRLFRILAGLDRPDTGHVLVGENREQVRRGAVGVVAQHYPLFNHRTLLSNLLVAGAQASMQKADAEDRAKSLLTRFKLEGHENKYPAQLSGGMRQRAAIAQQFMCSEHYLLMDEPFSGLDPIAVDRVIEFINETAGHHEHHTFIVVTHDIRAAMLVSDTLWLLGRDRNPDGTLVPGSRIQKTYNLIELGLAWQKGIEDSPEFTRVMREVRSDFSRL